GRRAAGLRQRLARGDLRRDARALLRGHAQDEGRDAAGRLAARAGGQPRERPAPLHDRRRLRLFRGVRERVDRHGKAGRPGGALRGPLPPAARRDPEDEGSAHGHGRPRSPPGSRASRALIRLGINSRPTASVAIVSPTSSQLSRTAPAGFSAVGAGMKNRSVDAAMKTQQNTADAHATGAPPGIRYGRGWSARRRRRITKAGNTIRYETRKHTPDSLKIIQNTLSGRWESIALPTSKTVAIAPITMNATWGVWNRACSRPSRRGIAPSAAAAAATRFVPRLHVTTLATHA